MSDAVITTDRLTCYYGSKCALDSVTLSVPGGKVFALLGRNGSGKSTLIRTILGLQPPTRGSTTILGYDSGAIPPSARARIGAMAEGHPLYSWMRISDVAAFQQAFFRGWNQKLFQTIVDHFKLPAKAKAGQLSRGERAGLALAATVATEPELLVLDDPALGLDPVARRSLLESLIFVTRRSDRTILFTSHLLSDVERVADVVAILDHSVLRVCAPIDLLRERVRRLVLTFDKPAPAPPEIAGLLYSRREATQLELTIANFNGHAAELSQHLGATSLVESEVSFEDAVIGFLGHRGERSIFQPEASP